MKKLRAFINEHPLPFTIFGIVMFIWATYEYWLK
jgi:hypothetical protein